MSNKLLHEFSSTKMITNGIHSFIKNEMMPVGALTSFAL